MKNTKEHILQVSLSLFLQKSFKEVTIKEIAEKTGYSKGAIYHYFESKEQLFYGVIDITVGYMIKNKFKDFDKESLNQFYHDYINNFIGNSELQKTKDDGVLTLDYTSLIIDALKIYPSFQEKLLESQKIELKSWQHIVSTAREKGEIISPMDDEQIANMFVFSADGVGMHSIFFQT